jgi:acetylornithine/N-succinyldiaminopimelate aminotransferase
MTPHATTVHSELLRWLKRHGPAGPDASMPLVARRASGAEVEGMDGREYLDFSSGGELPLGHNHRAIAAVLAATGHRCGTEAVEWPESVVLMHKLAELVPGGMNRRVLICDSGREALARAVALAQQETSRRRIVYLSETAGDGCYFGRDVAAVVAHPLDNRLKLVREQCSSVGTMLLDDETGVGPGMTGRMFAVEGEGVRPDVYVLGRGWAAGLPFGACITSSSSRHWRQPPPASPLAGAVCVELVRQLESGLLERATELGQLLERRFEALNRSCPLAKAAGLGTFQTLAFPAGGGKAAGYVNLCRDLGLLLKIVGPDAVGIRPALVVTDRQVGAALSVIEQALARFNKGGK